MTAEEKRKIAHELVKEYSLELKMQSQKEEISAEILTKRYVFLGENVQFKDEDIQKNMFTIVNRLEYQQEELQKQIGSLRRTVLYHEGALNLLEERIIDTHIETKYHSKIQEKKKGDYTFLDWLKIIFILGKPDDIVVTQEHCVYANWKKDAFVQDYIRRSEYLLTKAKEYARKIIKIDASISEEYEKINALLNTHHFLFKEHTDSNISEMLKKNIHSEVEIAKTLLAKKQSRKKEEKIKE